MRSLIVRHSPTGTPYPFRSPLGLLGVTHVAVGSFLITLSISTPEKNATKIYEKIILLGDFMIN